MNIVYLIALLKNSMCNSINTKNHYVEFYNVYKFLSNFQGCFKIEVVQFYYYYIYKKYQNFTQFPLEAV